jgi:hypothetical protein
MNGVFLAQIITLISLALVVIGWFANQWLNRRNEILKEARSRRVDMLSSFMDLVGYIEAKNTNGLSCNECRNTISYIPKLSVWTVVHIKIKMYGKNNEVKLYDDIMSEIYEIHHNTECHIPDCQFTKLYNKVKKLETLCINNIRQELKLNKINLEIIENVAQ